MLAFSEGILKLFTLGLGFTFRYILHLAYCFSTTLSGELRIRDCGNPYDRYMERRDNNLASVAAAKLFQRMLDMGIEPKDMIERARLDEGASPIELKCLEDCIFSHCCRVDTPNP